MHIMASVDGSRSLQGASDELYDIICGPCQTDNLDKQAHHYCNECREYMCNSCKDAHRKFAVSKSHTILSGKQIPARTSGSQRAGISAYCSCNKNLQVEFFCEDHQEVICNPCKLVKHRNCKTADVQEKSAGYTTARVNSMLTKIKSLIHEFDTMQKQRKSDRNGLKRLTEDCKKEIKGFRAQIDAILDKLEAQAIREVGVFDEEQSRNIDKHITALSTGLQMLNSDNKQLEDAKTNGNKVKMFITDVQVSKSLKEYEAMLAEVENGMVKPTLSFIGNKKLANFQTEITTLGSLEGTGRSTSSHEDGKKSNKKVFLGKKAALQNEARVISLDDKIKPGISGCTFMPSGHAVLCDCGNGNVKLLDKNLVLREHLKLCSWPWDVSVVDDNNVIITLPGTKQLQYIQVSPQLKTGRTIQLDKKCCGIEVFGDEIYTTQRDDSGPGEVQVLDLSGNRKRKVQTNIKFHYPWYITMSSSAKKIFVSGGYCDTATVICMTTDGNLVYQYKDKELRDPTSMYIDAEDNILVCDYSSDTVQVITANGKKYGTLLSSSDGIDKPYSIAYRETDDTLLVGCSVQDHVFTFKLD